MPRAETDIGMYERIADRLARGGDYYEIAAFEHRKHGYPLRPFYAVRPPALAWLTGGLGAPATMRLAQVLAIVAAVAWAWRGWRSHGPASALAAGLLIGAGGFLTFYHQQLYHELWSGLLLALAGAAYRRERPEPAAVLAFAAVLFREHALIFPAVFGIVALFARDRRGVAAWLACGAFAALYYYVHYSDVEAVLRPSDRTSPGWAMAPGLGWALGNMAGVGLLRLAGPLGPFLASIALTGWLGYRSAGARIYGFLLALLAVLAILARPDTYYWAFLAYPLLLGGLAFVPALVAQLWRDWNTAIAPRLSPTE